MKCNIWGFKKVKIFYESESQTSVFCEPLRKTIHMIHICAFSHDLFSRFIYFPHAIFHVIRFFSYDSVLFIWFSSSHNSFSRFIPWHVNQLIFARFTCFCFSYCMILFFFPTWSIYFHVIQFFTCDFFTWFSFKIISSIDFFFKKQFLHFNTIHSFTCDFFSRFLHRHMLQFIHKIFSHDSSHFQMTHFFTSGFFTRFIFSQLTFSKWFIPSHVNRFISTLFTFSIRMLLFLTILLFSRDSVLHVIFPHDSFFTWIF